MGNDLDTIPGLLDAVAATHGTTEGLVDGDSGRRLTFAELRDEVHRVAHAFVASGVRPGDRVAIWAPNVAEWVLAGLGASCAGAAIVPLNTRFKGHEAAYVLGKSKAKVLVTVNGFLGTDYVAALQAAGEDLSALAEIIVARGDAPDGTTSWAAFLERASQSTGALGALGALPTVSPNDLSDIIFTSGTTGRPKGVMTTHKQTTNVFRDWSGLVGLRHGDRYLIVNPFFHTFGYKAGIVACLVTGATIIPHPVFDVDAVLARAAEEHITMLPGPPTIYQMILDHPRRRDYDLSSLRLAVTGAAVVPVEMIKRMRTELTYETIVTGYGLTETTGTATMCRADDDPETIATTCGRAIPGVEVRVVDDHGVAVPTGQPGEVVVRGYNVMSGYYDDPEATASTIDADGWLHTGDIGVLDDRGYLRITDRKKDMFIVGGFNAYPAEIEQMMAAHPAISQVAVVGVADERLGEVGMAYVVPRPGASLDEAELIAWCRERMANYKVPRRIVVVDALPTNASGKVLKFELRAMAAEPRI